MHVTVSNAAKEIPISIAVEEIRSKLVDLIGHDARWETSNINYHLVCFLPRSNQIHTIFRSQAGHVVVDVSDKGKHAGKIQTFTFYSQVWQRARSQTKDQFLWSGTPEIDRDPPSLSCMYFFSAWR